MLGRAEVSEEPDDDDVVMIRDKFTFSRLFDTEDKDREEDVLHADVIWSPQSLLTDEEGQVHQGLLQLSPGQCF